MMMLFLHDDKNDKCTALCCWVWPELEILVFLNPATMVFARVRFDVHIILCEENQQSSGRTLSRLLPTYVLYI
jgi:hypothetical protein